MCPAQVQDIAFFHHGFGTCFHHPGRCKEWFYPWILRNKCSVAAWSGDAPARTEEFTNSDFPPLLSTEIKVFILAFTFQPKPTKGRMRIHCLENVDKALQFLKEQRVHLENMGSHDIVDGNHRLTLGLIWTIILRFQVQMCAHTHIHG